MPSALIFNCYDKLVTVVAPPAVFSSCFYALQYSLRIKRSLKICIRVKIYTLINLYFLIGMLVKWTRVNPNPNPNPLLS